MATVNQNTAGTSVANVRAASLDVSFLIVKPGLSTLTARHNGAAPQTITSSGTITFPDVSSGDTISVVGDSLGTTIITIDRDANPASMSFDPGEGITGIFLIN